ncbi:MAG: type II secretion system F family protein, partial [archaeon]|nr:type II secretion system F family protein [archaeon]
MSFSHADDKNLMVAIRLMQLMIDSGASIEETMRSIADEKLGKISKTFDSVLNRSMSGGDISDEIEKQVKKTRSKLFGKVLSILLM